MHKQSHKVSQPWYLHLDKARQTEQHSQRPLVAADQTRRGLVTCVWGLDRLGHSGLYNRRSSAGLLSHPHSNWNNSGEIMFNICTGGVRILRHFNVISVILGHGSNRYSSSEIEVVRPVFEFQTPFSASQELNHYTGTGRRYLQMAIL